MSAAADQAKRFKALQKQVMSHHAEADPGPPTNDRPDGVDEVLYQLLYSMLLWETTSTKAQPALRRINAAVVDYNELRVCLPYEIERMLGARYPRVAERAERMHAALNDLFMREHAVSLARLRELSKRDAKIYLESIEGLPPFVVARVLVLTLGAHAVPVDGQLLGRLVIERVLTESYDDASAGSWLERQLHAGEAADVHAALQAWVETPVRKQPASAGRTLKTTKKTTKKASRKTTKSDSADAT